MYIDGINLRTTRMLLAAGFPASRCIIVNDQIKDASIIPANAHFKHRASFSKAIDLLTPYQLDNLRVVWYDCCNTVLGNVVDRAHHPKKDIFKLLSKMKIDFTLFVTYVARTNLRQDRVRKALKGYDTDDSETEIDDYSDFSQVSQPVCHTLLRSVPKSKTRSLQKANKAHVAANLRKPKRYIDKKQKRDTYTRNTGKRLTNTQIHEALYLQDKRKMEEKQIEILTRTIELTGYIIKESPIIIKYKSTDVNRKSTNMVFIKFTLSRQV